MKWVLSHTECVFGRERPSINARAASLSTDSPSTPLITPDFCQSSFARLLSSMTSYMACSAYFFACSMLLSLGDLVFGILAPCPLNSYPSLGFALVLPFLACDVSLSLSQASTRCAGGSRHGFPRTSTRRDPRAVLMKTRTLAPCSAEDSINGLCSRSEKTRDSVKGELVLDWHYASHLSTRMLLEDVVGTSACVLWPFQ